MTDLKRALLVTLQQQRDAIVWKLDGLSEREVRWPSTPTGTNLLGLIKHLAHVERGYFALTFGRPLDVQLPGKDADPNDDLWARADESREEILDLYHTAWQHTDETVAELDIDSAGEVPWWPADRRQVTLGQVLGHIIAETARHAGQADIIRELADGATGHRPGTTNLPDDYDWPTYVAHVQRAAEQAGG